MPSSYTVPFVEKSCGIGRAVDVQFWAAALQQNSATHDTCAIVFTVLSAGMGAAFGTGFPPPCLYCTQLNVVALLMMGLF